MASLSLASYRKYLQGKWIHEEVRSHNWLDMWKAVFAAAYAHWKNGDDVFIAGADTIAVKPIKIFGVYTKMVLFWHTDPPRTPAFHDYLNAELVYLPHEVPGLIWDIGREESAQMRGNVYDESQGIWNAMFWAQLDPPALDPTMHYSPAVSTPIQPHEAKIWHLHGSRGPDVALREMRRLAS